MPPWDPRVVSEPVLPPAQHKLVRLLQPIGPSQLAAAGLSGRVAEQPGVQGDRPVLPALYFSAIQCRSVPYTPFSAIRRRPERAGRCASVHGTLCMAQAEEEQQEAASSKQRPRSRGQQAGGGPTSDGFSGTSTSAIAGGGSGSAYSTVVAGVRCSKPVAAAAGSGESAGGGSGESGARLTSSSSESGPTPQSSSA